MLLKLTEQYGGIVNPEVVVTNEIVVNTDFIQSIKRAKPQYPFKDEFTIILMASGNSYNVQETFEYIYQKMYDELKLR